MHVLLHKQLVLVRLVFAEFVKMPFQLIDELTHHLLLVGREIELVDLLPFTLLALDDLQELFGLIHAFL